MSDKLIRDVPFRICFVCTGNICRSPMAEVIFRSLRPEATVSSAGTGPWHEGEPMDPRTRSALEAGGYEDHGHLAQQFRVDWFNGLDLVVALDRSHRETLRSLSGQRFDDRIVLLRTFDPEAGGAVDVPDPYYDDQLFDRVLGLIEAGCRGLDSALAAGAVG